MTIISTEQVNKSVYTEQTHLQILSDISISVKAGETMAILGASGSGKSTLLSLLAGLDTPTSGKIKLLGQEISTLDEEQRTKVRAGQVGFVFQSFHLLPQLTTLENVMLPLIYNYNKVAKQKALSILENLGLGDRLMHLPKQLSGCEQQGVAIARALINNPEVIIADELTANLDTALSLEFMSLLEGFTASGKTVLLTSHDPLVIESSAVHRVLGMRDGRLTDD